jgi:predicted dienelactone hydrolase
MKHLFLLLIILLFVAQSFAQNAGYEVLRITDESRKRPIQIDVWYPTADKEQTYNYGISKGNIAAKAKLATGKFPMILLSHGAMGAASNYSWIAEYLSRRGYLVVGVSHFGESPVFGFDSIDQTSVRRFGDRTRDLNFALEFIIERSKFTEIIDSKRIGAIGHSSGGASVLMINGVEFSPKKIADYCQNKAPTSDKGCTYPSPKETDELRLLPTKSNRLFKALVALDPAIGQGFTKKGLKSMATPTLIIGSVKNDFLPYKFHSRYLAKHIKNAEIVKLNSGEGHFVYLDECSLPIKVMGIPLCTDANGVERNAVHTKLAIVIEKFLSRNI